jgi:cyclic pyranopterin phosphate synthase
MPHDGLAFQPNSALMSADEVVHFARLFVELGIKKIRLTGGEPLVRKDAAQIVQSLGKLPVELTITSNGLIIDRFIATFREAGIDTVNISLDSLNEEKFNLITRKNYLKKVKQNIQLMIDEGFKVKVNNVVMKGINEEEVLQFAAWTMNTPIDIRFIEYMPFGGNQWEYNKVVSYEELIQLLKQHYTLEMHDREQHSTSHNFCIQGAKGTLGIISSVTNPFCNDCNRLRLTADGKLKNCLFSTSETDLLSAYRNNEPLLPLIHQNVGAKHFSRGGLPAFNWKGVEKDYGKNRSMISIGG